MAELVFDVVEVILVRLDVRDLIRCKSVCKSWQSLISTPCFVKAHLKHAYKNDRDNHELGHRRVAKSLDKYVDSMLCCNNMHIVGSCNGLVCLSPKDAEFVVTNPSTREVKKLQTPPFPPYDARRNGMIRNVVCWGFGYDSSADEYKVIAGFRSRFSKLRTLFYALTLKSNTWKVIGEVKYRRLKGVSGILCDGALYWFMNHAKKRVIISLDLSTEEFKEIQQPTDGAYDSHEEHECNLDKCQEYVLGVLQECLCIYSHYSLLPSKIWVMKNNRWELYNNHIPSKYDVAHRLIMVDSQKAVYTHDVGTLVSSTWGYLSASIFVKSLVSPHTHLSKNNKGQKMNAMQRQEANESFKDGVKENIRKRKRNVRRKKFRKHKKPLLWILQGLHRQYY